MESLGFAFKKYVRSGNSAAQTSVQCNDQVVLLAEHQKDEYVYLTGVRVR